MSQVILMNPSNGMLMDRIDIWPPWALIYISTDLHKDYSIKIIDQRFDRNVNQILDNELNDDTLCVGVTALTGLQLKFANEFFYEVKKRMPSVKTVIGGIHVTSTPDDSINEPLVDFVVMGDGVNVFNNLVRAIDERSGYDNVKGICYKDNLGIPKVNPTDNFDDLNELGELPLHLVDMERYISLENGRRKLIIFSSRGCPFGCSYCHNSNEYNKNRWRSASAERTIEFIELLIKKYAIGFFAFQDDNFWAKKRRVVEFVSLIEKKDMDIEWGVYGATIVSLKYVTKEIAQKLKKSGLRKILCGIETLSPKIQNIVRKRIDKEDVYSVDKVMSSVGIKMIYSFMSGFPTENNEDIKMNINAMFKIKRQSPRNDIGNIKPVIYYPGTGLYNWAIHNGFVPPKTFDEWSKYSWNNYNALNYPWISKRRKKFLQYLYFATLVLNPEYEYINSLTWKYVCRLLSPFMRLRVKSLYFGYSPILYLLYLLKKLNLT